MCKLYPGGLRDNGIWLSAGGNLSVINLNQSGKGQWVEALRLVKHGGGGGITFESLTQEVAKEYPNNKDVKKLIDSSI